MANQTYEMTCNQCKELRWPYLREKPDVYTCVRCRSGVNMGKRESGRKGAAAREARRKHQAGPNG